MTTRNGYSTRPNKHTERTACMAFADALVGRESMHAVIAATLADVYRPAADAYVAARIANEVAGTEAELAHDHLRSCTAQFDTAFGRWLCSVDACTEPGYAATALRDELGHQSPASFLKQPTRDKADRMVTVLVHVDQNPALTGLPELLDALREATDVLAAAIVANDAALRARSRAVEALLEATAAFDRSWGALVRDLRRYDPEGLGAEVPRFLRTRGSRGSSETAATVPSEADTPGDPPPETEAA